MNNLKKHPQRYIILPKEGLSVSENINTPLLSHFLKSLTANLITNVLPNDNNYQFKVIDSIGETGAKLIELSSKSLASLKEQQPEIRIIPEIFYKKQRAIFELKSIIKPLNSMLAVASRVKIVSDGKPIKDVNVVAFTDFENRIGFGGKTNANGEVTFNTPNTNIKIERLYVYPPKNYWTLLKRNILLSNTNTFIIKPLNINHNDARRFFYPDGEIADGIGVTVGILDSGVGPHPDINVNIGRNMVTDENDPSNFFDVDEHGTHVAGVIAGNGNVRKGIAPGVVLNAYRVFPSVGDASNFDIMKAIIQATDDGCDILNMSLGGDSMSEDINEAIDYAFERGTVCFVATGNDGRKPVIWPAKYARAIAISAMGRKNTFPSGTADKEEVKEPFGTDKKNFVAGFSNIGNEVDFISPGVAIVSTVPTDAYAPMNGTSMACPIATGIAAKILSKHPNILALPRNLARTEAILALLFGSENLQLLGFGSVFEGKGQLKS